MKSPPTLPDPPKPPPLPELDEIMAYGLGLTHALRFWNQIANASLEDRANWRAILVVLMASLQTPQAPNGLH